MKTVNDVHQFLKGKTFWLSTVDGEGNPHVRPFGAVALHDGRLYICTNAKKSVSAQMKNHMRVEIAALDEGMNWFRFNGIAVIHENAGAKAQMLIENPMLKDMYEGNPDFEVWQLFGDASWVDTMGNVRETTKVSSPNAEKYLKGE